MFSQYLEYCERLGIEFNGVHNILDGDDTTLFSCSGMQKMKHHFVNNDYVGTFSDVQDCVRLNDLDDVGDGTHLAKFKMLGMYSFRELTVGDAVNFWKGFMDVLGIEVTSYTVHSDRTYWSTQYYLENDNVVVDDGCIWTDGSIGGYCTEFYVGELEIGNIVNTNGNCIDCGFGLERLVYVLTGEMPNRTDSIKSAVKSMLECGVRPGSKGRGYVLRKLLRSLVKDGVVWSEPEYVIELDRQNKILSRYNRLKVKHINKSKEWWLDTHGIDIDGL